MTAERDPPADWGPIPCHGLLHGVAEALAKVEDLAARAERLVVPDEDPDGEPWDGITRRCEADALLDRAARRLAGVARIRGFRRTRDRVPAAEFVRDLIGELAERADVDINAVAAWPFHEALERLARLEDPCRPSPR